MQNGELIASLRISKDMSQKDMAKLLNIALNTYKGYEINRQSMKLRDLNIISEYFNVSLDTLLNLTSNNYYNRTFKEINYERLGYILIYVRRRNNLSQKDLARIFKISLNSICKYENNPKCVSVYYLYLFAKKFNLSVDFICGKSEKKEILF